MSEMNVDSVLAQMRALSEAARGPSAPGPADGAEQVDFSALLKDSIDQVNEVQAEAKALKNAFETGATDVSLPEVMVAVQKASVSFEAITQVRNKLLNAYQEIMNMQV